MFTFIATIFSAYWLSQNWPIVVGVIVVIIAFFVWRSKKRRAYLALPVYFIGNKATKTYHTADCPHLQKTVLANRVAFRLPAETARLGYKPCGVCHPRWPANM